MPCRMELLQEECLALKARLDTVQQDKAEDLATYKQMHEQVRKIFHEACRYLRTLHEKTKVLKEVLKKIFIFRIKPLPPIGSRSAITV